MWVKTSLKVRAAPFDEHVMIVTQRKLTFIRQMKNSSNSAGTAMSGEYIQEKGLFASSLADPALQGSSSP